MVRFWIPGILFHVFAIRLEGNVGKPGTGRQMFLDSAKRAFLWFSFSEKRLFGGFRMDVQKINVTTKFSTFITGSTFHSGTQRNTAEHSGTQQNTAEHSGTQWSTAENTAEHSGVT